MTTWVPVAPTAPSWEAPAADNLLFDPLIFDPAIFDVSYRPDWAANQPAAVTWTEV